MQDTETKKVSGRLLVITGFIVLATIIGIVAPVKFQSLEEDVKKETLYFPFAQRPRANLILLVKTEGDPGLLATAVREAVTSLSDSCTRGAMRLSNGSPANCR